MKKIFVALLVWALLPTQSNAQQWLEVKGGAGLGLVQGYTGTLPGVSILSGVGYKHQISKRMMAEGDVLLDTRAIFYPLGIPDAAGNETYYTGGGTYVQIPLTLHYMMPFKKKELVPYRVGQPKSYWFIEGGPYVSYGLTVLSFNNPNIVATWAATEDSLTTAQLTPRKIDVGITTGIGVNFSINEGKRRLVVGLRNHYGLLNMYKDSRLGKATNFSAVMYLGYDISLTKKKHIRHRW